MPEQPEPWHLDKKVPISLILAILGQTAAASWFMAGLNSQVEQLRTNAIQQGERIRLVESSTQAQAVSGAATGAQIDAMADTLGQVRQDQRAQLDLLRQIMENRK